MTAGDLHLEVRALNAWYGESHVLHGVDLHVKRGEAVSLLGRNGAGKSTTLRAILGLLGRRSGTVRIGGQTVEKVPLHGIAALGVGYVPEERGIFPSLNVQENLTLLPVVAHNGFSLEELYALFPNLYERRNSRGTELSGGEQQMLAIARVLRTGARLLLLDEISEGLAPVIVERLSETVETLRGRGYTILLVEQNFHFAQRLADRFYVMEEGLIVDEAARRDLAQRSEALGKLLGV